LFCVPKAAVLHGKSVGFALQKSRFRSAKSKLPFSVEIIFTKSKLLLASLLEFLKDSSFVSFTKMLAPSALRYTKCEGQANSYPKQELGCRSGRMWVGCPLFCRLLQT